MKNIKLKIPKEECKENICPVPLELIPNIVKGISKITYDEKSGIAEIIYDENVLTQEQLISEIIKFSYKVLGEANG